MNKTLLRAVLVGSLGTALVATLGLSHRNASSDKRSTADAQSPNPNPTTPIEGQELPPLTGVVTVPKQPLPSAFTVPPSVLTFVLPPVADLIAQHGQRCASHTVADIVVPMTFEAALAWTDAVVVGTFSGQTNTPPDEKIKQVFPTLDSQLTISQVLWTKGRINIPTDLTFRSAGQIDSNLKLACVSPIPVPIPGVTYVVFVSEFAGGWSSALAMDGLYPIDTTGTVLSFDPGNDVTSQVAAKSLLDLTATMSRQVVTIDALAQDRANLKAGIPTTSPTLPPPSTAYKG